MSSGSDAGALSSRSQSGGSPMAWRRSKPTPLASTGAHKPGSPECSSAMVKSDGRTSSWASRLTSLK